ncbi:MAG: ABC transporter ATP-binding protein [Phycisphaerales bacterium]
MDDLIPLEPGEGVEQGPSSPDTAPDAGESGTGAIVVVDDLERVYRAGRGKRAKEVHALSGVSLRVHPGEILALLGANGSGKSTLLRILAGLEPIDAGGAWIDGRLAGTLGARARTRLGVVFQSPALDPLLTIRENLTMQGALLGIPPRDLRGRVDAAIAEVGLSDRGDDRVGRLSGGLTRRADLARAMLGDLRVLLIDEPTTGLDLASRRVFFDSLSDRCRRDGIAVLMSTHDFEEAERADRVVMLDRGRIVAQGTPEELIATMGDARILTDEHGSAALRAAGVDDLKRIPLGDRVAISGDARALARGAEALASARAPYSFGPGTLADVYLSRTGKPLEKEQGAEADGAPSTGGDDD